MESARRYSEIDSTVVPVQGAVQTARSAQKVTVSTHAQPKRLRIAMVGVLIFKRALLTVGRVAMFVLVGQYVTPVFVDVQMDKSSAKVNVSIHRVMAHIVEDVDDHAALRKPA
tara:strand:+ start:7214 stop:7552 length:339 start_codon:yes stop_codon:yes gene_type:complete